MTYGLVYVAVPKAGMTSVKIALARFQGKPERSWDTTTRADGSLIHDWWPGYIALDAPGLRRALEHRWAGWQRFTVVRDPIERFLSAYNNRFFWTEPDINAFVRRDLPRWIAARQHHEMPQADLIVDPKLYDHVGHTENLGATEAWLSSWAGRQVHIPRANASTRKRGWEDLSPENRQRVQELYRRDFELLGYAMREEAVLVPEGGR